MSEPRIGDTIFTFDGRAMRVEKRDGNGNPVCVDLERPRKKRTFTDEDDLQCVDVDDGLWQEVK
jgi:hypothetical protein